MIPLGARWMEQGQVEWTLTVMMAAVEGDPGRGALMTFSWKQVLLCGASVALVGAATYTVYKCQEVNGEKNEKGGEAANGAAQAVSKKKTRKKKSASSLNSDKASAPSSSKSSGNYDMLPPELRSMFEECDRPLNELLELPVEAKQQVFYGLLMKGEMHMKMPGMMEVALECFSKAVSMVPNPGEVVAALEKTLPPAVFNALLDKIQLLIQGKSTEYYQSLAPAGTSIRFVEDSISEPGTTQKVKVWRPTVTQDAVVGTKLWEETSDASALLWRVDQPDQYCEYCLGGIGETHVACPACHKPLYCSQDCCEQSALVFHAFFCQPSPSTQENIKELERLCKDNESSLALFMLRYVAFLLSEELRGNGAAQNGPFAHYDHLKSVFRAPNDIDRAEAKLLRAIFAGSNKNVADFLSDDIYASMKSTLARSIIAIQPEGVQALSRMESRVSEFSKEQEVAESVSFFPVAAHLAHSCDPNSVVVVCDGARQIRVAALKNLKAGEQITVSYLPFAEGTSAAERKLHLMRLFDLDCACDICEADLVIN